MHGWKGKKVLSSPALFDFFAFTDEEKWGEFETNEERLRLLRNELGLRLCVYEYGL